MKKLLFISAIMVSLASTCFLGVAQTTKETPSVLVARTNTLTAIVQDIDYSKREVTLKGPEGNTVKLKIGEEAKNFRQVKKGDEVIVRYYEAAAIMVGEPGGTAAVQKEAIIRRAAKGEQPGGTVMSTTTMTGTVEKIDRSTHEVTLKGPQGDMVTVSVDPSVGDLTRIKEGDHIQATYTEGLAISVERPKSGKDK